MEDAYAGCGERSLENIRVNIARGRSIHLSTSRDGNARSTFSDPLRPEQRKQNNVANRFRAGEQHGEPIDAEAKSAGWRHAVLEREQKFLIDLLRLFACLFEQTLTLQERIV